MITKLFDNLVSGVNELKSIELKNNGGIIIIDINESLFTDSIKNQIEKIDFDFYLNDGSQEPKRMLSASKSWTSLEDRAIAFNDVPASCYISVNLILNNSYIVSKNIIPESQYPISVSISDENILNNSGGSDAEIDEKIEEHNEDITAHSDIVAEIDSKFSDKQDRTQVIDITGQTTLVVDFETANNCDIRCFQLFDAIEEIVLNGYTDIESDFSFSLNFDSKDTAPTMTYNQPFGSLDIQWIGMDCQPDSSGSQVFTPVANKVYNIVFYNNGICIIGLVIGYDVSAE